MTEESAGNAVTHLMAPSGCKMKDLIRLAVLGFSVEQLAPEWRKHTMLCDCNKGNNAIVSQLKELRMSFSVTEHEVPQDPQAKRFGYMLKPWLLFLFVSTSWRQLPPSAVVVIVDTDQYLWANSYYLWANRQYSGVNTMAARRHCPENAKCEALALAPIAQEYAYGVKWLKTICSGATADICPNMTTADARSHFMIGVPYLLSSADFNVVAQKWFYYMQRVMQNERVGTRDILADQYAYALASFYTGRWPTQKTSMMLSNVHVDSGEAWSDTVDQMDGTSCSELGMSPQRAQRELPLFIHACQWYSTCSDGSQYPCDDVSKAWHFHKGHIPSNFLDCNQSLLMSPPEDLFTVQRTKAGKRSAFMVCALVHSYNAAAQEQCLRNGGQQRPKCTKILRGMPKMMYRKRNGSCLPRSNRSRVAVRHGAVRL